MQIRFSISSSGDAMLPVSASANAGMRKKMVVNFIFKLVCGRGIGLGAAVLHLIFKYFFAVYEME
jgi:hypothetical protein